MLGVRVRVREEGLGLDIEFLTRTWVSGFVRRVGVKIRVRIRVRRSLRVWIRVRVRFRCLLIPTLMVCRGGYRACVRS